ncbi:hypothetical protein BcepF1.017 [Burkholderia phage BcepF1]|uniref:Uncharacterized protein n=1 Tax=Burkholderia phage BcepF1 TaxID=2886897 RepID=A1YZS1_9CAUD|nr:hypothetical protein BcepF1.017 [Burkholderia phage BcepF1]ABL96748.1 hypothetical protein BcepF1.017 [Burkholderia phage BcepF1]
MTKQKRSNGSVMRTRPCCVEGCEKPAYINFRCHEHHRRFLLGFQTEDVPAETRDLVRELFKTPKTVRQVADLTGIDAATVVSAAWQSGATILFNLPDGAAVFSTARVEGIASYRLVAEIMQLSPGMSCTAIARLAQRSNAATRRIVREFHENGLAHISGWNPIRHGHEPRYMFWAGKDAPKPAPLTSQQVSERYYRKNRTSTEFKIKRANRRRAEKLTKNVQRDPMIAAFFGPSSKSVDHEMIS